MPVRPNTGSAADGLRLRDAARTKRHTADFLDSTGDAVGARWERREADEADRRANDILKLPDKPATGTGGTWSENGRGTHDVFLGLMKTCQKLGVSFFDYLGDRLDVPDAPVTTPLSDLVLAAKT